MRAESSLRIMVRLFFSFLFLFPIALITGCSQEKRWDGTMTRKNGITYVENHGVPLFEQDRLRLERVFTVGEESDLYEGKPLAKIRSVAVNHKGDIFIGDAGNSRVVVLDSNGKLLRTFGAKGQGPGEFVALSKVVLSDNGLVLVSDAKMSRISIFTEEGKLIRLIPVRALAFDFDDTRSLRIAVAPLSITAGYPLIIVYDTTGAQVGQMGESLESSLSVALSGEMGRVVATPEALLYAFPFPYLVREYSFEGSLRREIRLMNKDFVPPTPSRTLESGHILAGELPVSINGLGVTRGGYIITFISRYVGLPQVDFFSLEGKYLTSVMLPEEHDFGCLWGNSVFTFVPGIHSKLPSVTRWDIKSN